MKFSRVLTASALAATILAPSVSADQEGGGDISGTWNVQMRETWSTCEKPGEVTVFQWLVADNGGRLDVQVLGQTGFPKYTGGRRGNQVELIGVGNLVESERITSSMRLKLNGNKLEGERLVATATNTHHCATHLTVTASKQ